MPKQPAPPDRSQAGSGRGGAAPDVLIDDLAAERNSPPLPPEPVFTIDLVEAERGKRGRRYVADLEEHASRNARAAAEARRIALEQRSHLEAAARGRRTAEREISKLQRELRTALADRQRLTAQRTKSRRDRARAPETPPAAAEPRGGAARSELTRTRETVEQQQRLLHERREQLVHALRERDEARIETRRVGDARDRAERQLARATEILQHNALEETARIAATTQSTNDAAVRERTAEEGRAARSELEVQVLHLTQEIERLSTRAVELDEDLSRETSRADIAEAGFAELAITRSLALDELGQLAASEPAHEPVHERVAASSPRPVRVSKDAAGGDGEPVEPGDLRRLLLADLSDLAHEPVSRDDA